MLEKRFNVTFKLKNARLKTNAFTGTFTEQRLERILEYFKIVQDTVEIFGKS